MSGLSRTPGKRVGAKNPPRVRIPLPPPVLRRKLSDCAVLTVARTREALLEEWSKFGLDAKTWVVPKSA